MFFPPELLTSRATPIRDSHQRRLSLHCGSWRISVLERPLDIYSNITLSIRRHRKVQAAKIYNVAAGQGQTSLWRSRTRSAGILFLLPLLKSSASFGFTPPSSSNFLAVYVQNWNPVDVFFHPQLLTWVTYVYDFEVKWMLELRSIRERSQEPRHKVAHILLDN